MKYFALAGNPNCGKTTLFNALTGATAHVGNWPGVTVDKREGIYKKCDEPISIVDLPGIYSLSPYTPEEVISRNYILDNDGPSCVINIIDATNLERNLYLTTQLIEMDVPVVIALNMYDVIEKKGIKLDLELLEKEVGVPVVAISAQKGTNIDLLMSKAYNESFKTRVGKTVLENSTLKHLINDIKTAFVGLEVAHPLFHAIKLIENDEVEIKDHPDLVKVVNEFKKTYTNDAFGDDLEAIIADGRYSYITKHYTKAKADNVKASDKLTISDKIDRIVTNKWLGIPLFLIILYLIFRLAFAENLFWVDLGGNVSFKGSMFEGLFVGSSGINSPGVILFNFVEAITTKINDLFRGWLVSINAQNWIISLFCDGILAGVFAVLSFVPQILLLFLLFSIIEDLGYMARVAFIFDKIFRKFGLTGRAFMPMIMGFGCSVPAMINTRTLADENERCSTIRVIPFFSCGAKLPILTAITGGIAQSFGFAHVWLLTFGMYVIGVVVAIITALIMRYTVMRGPLSPFIMELPEYHMPQPKALAIHLWDKLKHYIEKAFTVILASTIVIWFLQSFTFDWKFIEQANPTDYLYQAYEGNYSKLDDFNKYQSFDLFYERFDELDNMENKNDAEIIEYNKYNEALENVYNIAYENYSTTVNDKNYKDTSDSILAGFGKLIQPIFTPLGFGKNLNDNGWVYGVSAVTGLIAKENVVATFSVLAQCSEATPKNVDEFIVLCNITSDEEGIESTVKLINNTGIKEDAGVAALIAYIIFNMTTIPCFAAVATARGELTKKKFRNTIIFWLVTSYVVSSILFLSIRYIWPIAIFVGLGILSIFGIYFYNKYKDAKGVASN